MSARGPCFCHLAALAGFVVRFPGGSILGPLILWLIKREHSAYVNEQGKEAINFQITMSILGLAVVVLMMGSIFYFDGFFRSRMHLFGSFLFLILVLADLILIVMAAIATNKGEPWRYPFALRLIK